MKCILKEFQDRPDVIPRGWKFKYQTHFIYFRAASSWLIYLVGNVCSYFAHIHTNINICIKHPLRKSGNEYIVYFVKYVFPV